MPVVVSEISITTGIVSEASCTHLIYLGFEVSYKYSGFSFWLYAAAEIASSRIVSMYFIVEYCYGVQVSDTRDS